MRMLEVFDYYFLAMMMIYCGGLYFYRSKRYKDKNDYKSYKVARGVSGTIFVISVLLFIAARFV
ncbi:CLC_0170 family protein [Clostridium sp.]|uniref:CLC_0170 family protein n=1 Tax=Clostridium sp. TaxID=1506 RepID=UPI003464D814